jgi:hypothetical protein
MPALMAMARWRTAGEQCEWCPSWSYAEQVAHEFDGGAKRNVTDHRKRQDDLIEPSLGDRQHEEDLAGVIGLGRREDVIECGAGLTKLPVDEWAATLW